MRIFTNPVEAVKEVERDLWEMGIVVHPQTMQDKHIANDPDYETREMQGYAFKITNWTYQPNDIRIALHHFFAAKEVPNIIDYCQVEIMDRLSGEQRNPGNSYVHRQDVWNEFLHNGKFAYTYSERMAHQVWVVLKELRDNPESRQGIINIHTYICPLDAYPPDHDPVIPSADLHNRGGIGRIPCSMYYQIMVREKHVDLIYTMRSCDLLTHFPIDIALALMLQNWFAVNLGYPMGTFTYFVGSLHAYVKEMKTRGIF